jgi:hypothetical protein
MSLAGRLSDLSLAELLQIVALSRKSGVLEICSEDGTAAWIGLAQGKIVRVALSDGSLSTERVLEKRGLTRPVAPQQLDAALQEAALESLLDLLEWHAGQFTFEPCSDLARWTVSEGIALPLPMSPEYLALEGARIADESRGASRAEPARTPPVPVICVDRDLALLERIKGTLADASKGVHIFQDSASALTRLKQYLVRGEVPVLVVGTDLRDPLDPRRGLGWRRFAERVQALAPRVRIAVIVERDAEAPSGVAFVRRPQVRATEADIVAFLQTVRGAVCSEA